MMINSSQRPTINSGIRLFSILLILLYCTPSLAADEWIYSVQPGDNLWTLSKKHLVSIRYWKELQTLNKVEDPLNIPPGKKLRFPVAWLKSGASVGQLVALAGEVQVIDQRTSKVKQAQKNMILWENDTLKTLAGGSATLQFSDGSKIQLLSNSELKLGSLISYGATGMAETRARLNQGRSQNRVKPKTGPASRFEISTPSAIAAVRGTEYRITSDPNGESKTEVLQGEVGVKSGDEKNVVPKGFGLVSFPHQKPLDPIKLLGPPDLSKVQTTIDRLPFALDIGFIHGAVKYRLQLSDSHEFETLLHDSTYPPGKVNCPDLPDGKYFFRIRGIDENGLEGLDSVLPFVMNAHPLPPLQIAPAAETFVKETTPTFTWSEPQGAASYKFQLAPDELFEQILIDEMAHPATNYTLSFKLNPGIYFWRVATTDNKGKTGPFSDPLPFRRSPSNPDISGSELDNKEMVFRWRKGKHDQKYRCQISSDTEFESIVSDEVVTKPQYSFKNFSYSSYYIRVANIDADGYQGPFSPFQKVVVTTPSYWAWFVPGFLLIMLLL